MKKKMIDQINKYYTEKIIKYGTTPKGVDWNGYDSQNIRFKQLLKLINEEIQTNQNFNILDFGCGFGSLLTYLKKQSINMSYIGYDISDEMLKQARLIYPNEGQWINKLTNDLKVDYVIASGLFNVKQDQNLQEWEQYIINTLDLINSVAKKGFSFNILTSYSDKEFLKDHLYYASPEYYFKYCKLNYSKQVALLHDYNLYEFTLIIRK